MKILIFIGTRPEAIKLAPVINTLRKADSRLTIKVVFTGQHKEMVQQVCDVFEFSPDINLDVMTPNQNLANLTSILFKKIDEVVAEERPDWIIAQGDTTSVFVASVIAFYNRIKFAHVEAGLRTHNKYSPFPEEFNRKVTGFLADVHFAPTQHCVDILVKEGIDPSTIIMTGNTVIDALLSIAKTKQDEQDIISIPDKKKLILVTAHRRENFSELESIFRCLRDLAYTYDDTVFIYPVHLNPSILAKAKESLGTTSNIRLIPPLDYKGFVHLMKRADLILTDSGGIQEEAPSFGTPILIIRDTTERPEGIAAGVAKLVGNKYDGIAKAFSMFHKDGFPKHSIKNPYGDGKASERIANFFIQQLSDNNF